ncbi:acyl carrier protein 3, mitochondrial-like isoform X1 [Miscanthus floridulus]|uniref:acyl carrier protein 3, mitochondrial-like isoform X1 n=1 Tax=Miscanthus floridulus TaxID=154761 RepID=UPI00345972DD
MQTVRSVVLQHLRLRAAPAIAARGGSGRPALYGFARGMSAPAGQEDSKGSNSDSERDIRTRVVNLVKKFDKIDADNDVLRNFELHCSMCELHTIKGVPSAESSRSVRGLGKGVSSKPYPRLCNARRLRLEPGTFRSQAVTETADFQKDLSLDSLDRVELVMAFEQEFSVEIPDDKADKLTCCADVAKYIISESQISDRSGGGS